MARCPSIAPLVTHGAIMLSCAKPAMNVWGPHAPKGALMLRRFPRRHLPRWRVMLVFTEVPSMKTTCWGCRAMAGRRQRNQACRARLTWGFRRSSAMGLFFVREPQPTQQIINATRRRRDPVGIQKSSLQVPQDDVGVLFHQFGKEPFVGNKLAVAGTSRVRLGDLILPLRSLAGEYPKLCV